MKKHFLLAFFIIYGSTLFAQTPVLEKLWETDTIVNIPESVLAHDNKLYISLIKGSPWEADGIGGIGILSPDGKSYDSIWVKGLNAPKGLGLFGNHLYAADLSEVAVINTTTRKIETRISIPGASGLNDITVDRYGIVYVSDSKTGKIWKIKNNIPQLFLENIDGVNGLKAIGTDLYIGAGKKFIRADKDKELTTIAELPQPIDGIEPAGNGGFILSAWSGYIFYVTEGGTVNTLLETHQQKKNTADIGFDPKTNTLYVPTFFGKTVAAYKLNFSKK